jgi:hypothetical protein
MVSVGEPITQVAGSADVANTDSHSWVHQPVGHHRRT